MAVNSEPNCRYIVLSDHVIKEAGSGKLTLIGTFHNMNFTKFPNTTPNFVTTVSLDNFEGDLRNVKVTIRLEDGSGHVFCSVQADVNSKVPFTRQMTVDLPVRFPRCQIPSPGLYQIVVLIDNEKVGERALPIVPVTGGTETEIKET